MWISHIIIAQYGEVIAEAIYVLCGFNHCPLNQDWLKFSICAHQWPPLTLQATCSTRGGRWFCWSYHLALGILRMQLSKALKVKIYRINDIQTSWGCSIINHHSKIPGYFPVSLFAEGHIKSVLENSSTYCLCCTYIHMYMILQVSCAHTYIRSTQSRNRWV
jgi:hypothetical protein